MNQFSKKLEVSGYNQMQRRDIIESGVIGYERRVERQNGQRHRRCVDTKKERQVRKLTGKNTWFKIPTKKDKTEKTDKPPAPTTHQTQKGRRNRKDKKRNTNEDRQKRRQPTTVLFVPRTEGGELARRLKDKETEIARNSYETVRIVERNGDRIEHVLVQQDPFGDEMCDRPDCLLCLTTDKERGTCRKTNLVYCISCNTCSKEGRRCQYWGETACSRYQRGAEHRGDLESKRDTGHIFKHLMERHPTVDLTDKKAEDLFSMKVHKRYTSAMDCQLGEALCITRGGHGLRRNNELKR